MRLSARERDLQSQDNIDVESPQAHHQLISKPSPSPPQTKARFVLKTLLHVLVACFFRFSAIVFGTLESCVFGRRVWMSRVRRDQSILRAIRDAGIGLRRMRWRESVRCTVYHQSDMQRYFTPKGTQRRQVINVRSVDQGTPPTPPLPKFTITSWPFDFVALSIAVNGAPTQFATDFQVTVTRFEVMKGPMLVISSTRMIRPENAGLCGIQGTPFNPIKESGFAAIYGPDGRQLTPQTESGEERILYADIDLDDLLMAKLSVNPVGHYSRPDLLAPHLPTPAANLNPLVKEGEKSMCYRPQLAED